MYPRPKSPYAASKMSGEHYCLAFTRAWGVPTVSLRYFNVYGPGQDPASEYAAVVPRFIVACLTGGRPEVHGDGEQSRDFTYVDDVVQANILAARAAEPAHGEAFNIGAGGEPTSVNGLLDEIARQTGASPDPVRTPAREGDVRHTKADVSKARRLLGYEPRFSITEGLRRTVDYFRTTLQPVTGHTE
jgi:UDP-glucose 4-epimerase